MRAEVVPAPPACPSWCPNQAHGWDQVQEHRHGVEGFRFCTLPLGESDALTVEATLHIAFDTAESDAIEATPSVRLYGEFLTAAEARRVSDFLVRAADLLDGVA